MTPARLSIRHHFERIGNLATALKACAIGVAVMALFYQDLSLVFADALRDESTSYILATPFILAYLLYRKRKMLRATIAFEARPQARHIE